MSETTVERNAEDWLVRPCKYYKEEYSDCKTWRARFHQHFIFGEKLDCEQWKKDFDNCVKWDNYQDEDAKKEVLESEKRRRYNRLKPHYANKVWTKRDKPPADWNRPLPEWMEKDFENSYLQEKSAEMKSGNISDERKLCVIS